MDQFNFNTYPYSDFNAVNLEWIISQINDFMEKVNSGYFKGPPGKDGTDYILTPADKQEIAEIVLEDFPVWQGGDY